MELRQREIDIELAELQMIRTKSLNEFKGDISLSVGITGDNERLGSVYDNPTQNPRVAISFTVPIFDWGEKKARVKAQRTAQTIAKLRQENEKLDIELNIRQVWRWLENLRTQITIAEKNDHRTDPSLTTPDGFRPHHPAPTPARGPRPLVSRAQ